MELRDFTFLTGDVCWEDHGGKWVRHIDGTIYHIVDIFNWQETCGRDAPEDVTHHVELVEVDLDCGRLDEARRSCGWAEDWCDEYGEPFPVLAKVEALHGYGAKAPLSQWNGTDPEELIEGAVQESYALTDDEARYREAMERPVNAVGATAREYQRGEMQPALLRGLARGDEKAELMLKLGMGRK